MALHGPDARPVAFPGLNSGTGALPGPVVRSTALLGLDVVTGALSGLNSGPAFIEATEEASGL